MSRGFAIAGIALSAASLGWLVYRDNKPKPTIERFRFRGVLAEIRNGPGTSAVWRWHIAETPSVLSGLLDKAGEQDTRGEAVEAVKALVVDALAEVVHDHPLPPKPTATPPLTGPPVDPYDSYTRGPFTIDLSGLSTGIRWRAFATEDLVGAKPADDIALGRGVQPSADEAKLAAEAFVDALPPPDSVGGDTVRHGLRVSAACDEITVDDAVQWVAWAAPRLAARAHDTAPGDLVGEVFVEAFPDCDWSLDGLMSGGAPMVERIEGAAVLGSVHSGAAVPLFPEGTPNPFEHAAAGLVGAVAPQHGPPRFAYNGHVVTVGAHPAVGWKWRVWAAGRAGAPKWSGGHPTAGGAAAAARQAVDGASPTLVLAGGG
ncbi:MAG: hypothetical protein K0V04_02965 [Deltaproteobacteria bacterium]|nr:hypothetical protein [Deltaproteobacteria bacterium]